MTSLSELYGTMSGPSRSDIRVVPQPQQPGVIVGPSPRDIQFAQGPIVGPTMPRDIQYAADPGPVIGPSPQDIQIRRSHDTRREMLARLLMHQRRHARYAVEVGQPQIAPHYSIDVGEPVIADQVVAQKGLR